MIPLLSRSGAGALAFGLLALSACGAGAGNASDPLLPRDPAPPCSQLHRVLGEWQDPSGGACGPDLSRLLEVAALGDGRLLFHRRFGPWDDVWTMRSDGVFEPEPVVASQPIDHPLEVGTAGVVAVPSDRDAGQAPRAFLYDPRQPQWRLFSAAPAGAPGASAVTDLWGGLQRGQWPPNLWEGLAATGPWNHAFLALDEERLLDWNEGTGAFRVWRFAKQGIGEVRLEGPSAAAPGPGPGAFRREHRIVRLDRERLLEWMPRPCLRPSDTDIASCTGADYRVWRHAIDPSDPLALSFEPEPDAAGFWPEIGAAHEIVAGDDGHLVVWEKDRGELRSYALPAAGDPLGAGVVSSLTDGRLVTLVWKPPTASPRLRNLLLILQDGHSFDSYFGHYCRGPVAADGRPIECNTGPDCCEAMPAAVPGAPSCRLLDPETDAHPPADTPACMRAKMDGGAMDAFASAPPDKAGTCGDPLDFACSGGDGNDSSAIASYHLLARQGALADRFFQTYAYAGAGDDLARGYPPARYQNFLYLLATRFVADYTDPIDKPLVTKELARMAVPWAVYTGDKTLALFNTFGLPSYYDPSWAPFRSLSRELGDDLVAGILPPVTIVLPDGDDAERSELPGRPFANGIRFVDRLVQAVLAGPQAADTLVLVGYLTAGGFFDHVRTPEAPPLQVDATHANTNRAEPIAYGPRVPLLALGPFARPNHITHDRLEMSSIAAFIEWNWLGFTGVKHEREPQDGRSYRDAWVANLGDLLDPAATVVAVPGGAP